MKNNIKKLENIHTDIIEKISKDKKSVIANKIVKKIVSNLD